MPLRGDGRKCEEEEEEKAQVSKLWPPASQQASNGEGATLAVLTCAGRLHGTVELLRDAVHGRDL
jgi:hypothetical protein